MSEDKKFLGKGKKVCTRKENFPTLKGAKKFLRMFIEQEKTSLKFFITTPSM
jgi:hypothetical protein